MTTEFEAKVAGILKIEDDINEVKAIAAEKTEDLRGNIATHKEIIAEHESAIDEIEAPYNETISFMMEKIQEVKEEIAEEMTEIEEKTIDLDIAKVQMKTTKSVKVLDKKALIDTLANLKGGLEKGVKTFALSYIRKLMEVDEELLEDIAAFEEKNTVYIFKKLEENHE
ncbi:hypothetical protein KAR91_44585 [Candidatus Pacearchaeota archaeon]|nr:hypothetical protein [Candidatus Pacearchaeota archaeon]